MRVRSVKFVHMRASQSGLQQQQGEETAVGLYIIVVFIFSQYYRIEKMLLLATWLLSKGLDSQTCYVIHCYTESALSWNGHKSSNIRRINVLHGTRTHWWIKTSWKSSLSMSHPTCYMLQLAVFNVDISHCTESVSIPPNCWLVMNHTCRLYAWLHIGLALQVKLLLCFHSSSLLPIKNEQCLCNSIQKDSFLG